MQDAMAVAQFAIRENYPEDEWFRRFAEEKRRILDRMIDEIVCTRFARESGITVKDEEVDFQIKSLREKAGINSEEEFLEALKEEGLTLEEFHENTRKNIIKQRVLGREVYSKIEVSDADVRRYYEENSELFKERAKVQIGLLLLEVKSGGESEWETVKERIDMLHTKLTDGASFYDLVREFSQGPSVDEGGDIGYIQKGEGLPEFEAAAFNLKSGEISSPFRTSFGWNIIKILDYVPDQLHPLDERKDQIRQFLKQVKARDIEQDWFEIQRSRTYIKIKE